MTICGRGGLVIFGVTQIGPSQHCDPQRGKERSGDGHGDPREAVGPEKERRLRRAAEITPGGTLSSKPGISMKRCRST